MDTPTTRRDFLKAGAAGLACAVAGGAFAQEKGAPADLILVDLGQPWVVDKALLKARSKNSPFDESRMQGRVLLTMVAGIPVYEYSGAGRG